MARVQLEHVDKVYEGGAKIVSDVSLDVADRELLVLVGPSGCGKSTTLRMIAGLESVTAGTISIDGRIVNDVPPKDRDIAMVFQSYALYPHMTVYENMAFGLAMRKTPKPEIDAAVRRAADILGITPLLERRPKALSGGQRQRVALGRAIVRAPKCFLFDEPLSNLDAKLRVEMRAELKRLHLELGSTVIYVTHDQEEAITLGDRVVVMKDGVIQQCGPALEIYRRPVNRFVAGFLGSPPMNFLEGRLVDEGGRLFFVAGDGAADGARLPVPAWAAAGLRAGGGAGSGSHSHIGAPLVLGVRPEALALKSHARFETSDNVIAMKVWLVQPLGDRADVYFSTPRQPRIVAQMDAASAVAVGETVDVYVDLSRVHFFAAAGGDDGRSLIAETAAG
jgi:multiple sugar transport system ATP-binding protein